MINIEIDKQFNHEISDNTISDAINATFSYLGLQLSQKNLSVVISGDHLIRDLNKRFLGIDSTTDVLAFPAHEMDPDKNLLYLGDIIISFPQLKRQSLEHNNVIECEMALLCVHGTLHLLGYNHDTEENKSKMWKTQSNILKSLGFQILLNL